MMWAALVTLGGVALGWFLNEITRARTARAEIARRRSDFQRETLLELQDVLNEVTHLTVTLTEERIDKARITSEGWASAFASEEVQEAHRAAYRRGYILLSRVQDDRLRELGSEVLYRASAAVGAADPTAAGVERSATADRALVALTAIGDHLRGLL